MQATSLGPNLTGATQAPHAVQAMVQATEEMTPFGAIDTSEMEARKMAYAAEADAVGSVPTPKSIKGVVKSGMTKVKGGQPSIFLDKLGERLAYERTGVRLYDALIVKYQATQQMTGEDLPQVRHLSAAAGNGHGASNRSGDGASGVPGDGASRMSGDGAGSGTVETAAQTLQRIRNEEFAHFRMLTESITGMGGDPTSMTPCADVTAMASSGFMQVLNDPRTTLAQCLNAMLAVELADNAGWELLASLADDAGENDLAGRFLGALAQEQEHLSIIKQWLVSIVVEDPKPSVI